MSKPDRDDLLTKALVRMDRRKQKALREYREKLKAIEGDYNKDKVAAYEKHGGAPKPLPKAKTSRLIRKAKP
jgi:hypothetical protein